jgi:hypothetical protein
MPKGYSLSARLVGTTWPITCGEEDGGTEGHWKSCDNCKVDHFQIIFSLFLGLHPEGMI